MKTQIKLLAVLVLTSQFALAQTPTPVATATPVATPAPTLAANMDSIAKLVQTLVKNINDPSKNTASAVAAGQLVTLFTATLSQVPTSIAALPASQQAAATAGYQSLIQKEIADAKALQAAFVANNNSSAASILQDMNTLKSQGHSAYAQ